MLKKLLIAIVLVILAVVVAFYTVPWKNWLEQRLKTELAKNGLAQLEFAISDIGLHEISFKNISFNELQLPDLSVSYAPFEIINGKFQNLHATSISFRKDNLEINLKDIKIDQKSNVNNEKLQGEWSISDIAISGSPISLPQLTAKGTIELAEGILQIAGKTSRIDNKTNIDFKLSYPLDDANSAIINIKNIELPWNEGTISADNVKIPLYAKTPINLNVKVKKISLNQLLAIATSNKATATGVVSGTIPLIVNRDGTFILKKGNLQAEKAGIINLSPDILPSEAMQVELLSEALKDFHYTSFNMAIESGNNEQIAMLLSLAGNNPEVYNGREIKLTVHLSGDVLQMVTQTMSILGK